MRNAACGGVVKFTGTIHSYAALHRVGLMKIGPSKLVDPEESVIVIIISMKR